MGDGLMDLKIEFVDKELTPWAGLVLMKQMIDRMGFKEALDTFNLPQPGSNRGFDPQQLILQFMSSIWCGANRFEHTEITRQDHVIKDLLGFKVMAGHKAFQRFFNKFTLATNQHIFTLWYKWFFSQLSFDHFTLDVDSTVHTKYGQQQGAKKGYNTNKPGRKSHHPLMAFIPECRMVANFWLRSGDSYTSNNIEAFLDDTMDKLAGKSIGLFRADSGFYDKKVLQYLEKRDINYIVAVRLHRPLQMQIATHKPWIKLDHGIEIAQGMYQSPTWEKSRRIIMVRQYVPQRPMATGKTLKLFSDDETINKYRYSCFMTNLDLPAESIWALYRKRADAENRIKELKYDFGSDSFNMKSFYGTEAALNVVMMAYNMISLFRQAVMHTKVHEQMKTLRYNVFAIGGYIVRQGNQRILKLALAMKRREWFTGLWMNTNSFKQPIVFGP
jgi:hypothetical protein